MRSETLRIPRDASLSALGLLMQLGGQLFFWLGIYALVATLSLLSFSGPMLLVVALSLVRSWIHRRAGRQVVRGEAGALRPYLIVAAVHTAGVTACMFWLLRGFSIGAMSSFVLLLAWWPALLAVLCRRAARIQRERGEVDQPAEDRGLTGLALLMLGMGGMAAIMWISLAIHLFGTGLSLPLPGLLKGSLVALMVLFLAQNLLHLRAGVGLLRTFHTSAFARHRDQYFIMAVIAAAATGVVTFITTAGAPFTVTLMFLPLLGVLTAWPAVVRDFGAVAVEDFDGEVPSLQPATDGGLSTLGVVLIASGVFGLIMLWVRAAGDLGGPPGRGAAALLQGDLGGLPTPVGVVVALANLAAGVQLLRLTPLMARATYALLGVAVVAAVWQAVASLQAIDALLTPRMAMARSQLTLTVVLQAASALLFPTLAAVQVWRVGRRGGAQRG